MLSIIILVLGVILGIWLMKLKSEAYKALGFVVILVSTVVLLILSINIPVQQQDNKVFVAQYNSVKELLEAQRATDCDAFERVQIANLLVYYNETIAEHKVKSASLWTDLWYSEEISNLPYLK